MNALQPILNKQTIRIDNHQRNVVNDWNDPNQDIHIHKCSNYKKPLQNYEFRISLRGGVHQIADDVPSSILKELKKFFSNEEQRLSFVESVYRELIENWQWHQSSDSNEEYQRKVELAKQIVESIGLAPIDTIETASAFLMIMRDRPASCFYYFTYNYIKQCFFIGEFMPGITRPLRIEAKEIWINIIQVLLEKLLHDSAGEQLDVLYDALNTHRGLPIGAVTIENTLMDINYLFR